MLSSNPTLNAIAATAMAAFDALSPEEQRVHRREQRISWVRGEMMIEYPKMTFERATELAEQAVARRDAGV